MNKQELEDWIKSAKYYGCAEFLYDDNGNKDATYVYEKDGKLYTISFCNDHPCSKWDEKGRMTERDENGKRIKDKHGEYLFIYEPVEVKEVKKMVEVTEYIPLDKE